MKAQRLTQGDMVGIVSPSWAGAGLYPHRVERGVRQLERMGFAVRLVQHAVYRPGDILDTAENRAADLHGMFADSEVRAIVAAIGGDNAIELLPLLDFDLVRRNPKVFIGFSDITVLNVAIWKMTGLVTFNGPALLTDFAEFPDMYPYTQRHFLSAVGSTEAMGRIEPSPWWTEEFLDWGQREDLVRPRAHRQSEGWTWLRGGVGEGVLVGGCLESLDRLRGTAYWPNLDGAVLFIETSERKPSVDEVCETLGAYERLGVVDGLQGLLVGRSIYYSDDEKAVLRDRLVRLLWRYRFPIVTDMDFGHTAPQFTLPIGVRVRVDGARREVAILEGAVAH